METLTRPIAPYIVPVPGFTRPDGVPDVPAPTGADLAAVWG